MCFFPNPNLNINSIAYKKGVEYFDCGVCPECLQKRSSVWALRAVYEAREHVDNCMVTLTYDTYKYDSRGKVVGENPVNPDLVVSKRHAQLFLKRLRKAFPDNKIKYILCAEYGSTTHRAHYHAIIFNLKFPDLVYYKKSKRGNPIYKSALLTKIWSHGICTVDCINVGAAVARYCTKYCAKSRSGDTFMLFSHGIGLVGLMRDFNGKGYVIDGRHYPIPRIVWQQYIMQKYGKLYPFMSYRYVNRVREILHDGSYGSCLNERAYRLSCCARSVYRTVRDKDSVYCSYLDFWQRQGEVFDSLRPSVIERIYSLSDSKYHFYKEAALSCYADRLLGIPRIAPGSKSVSRYHRWLFDRYMGEYHLPYPPCHNTANDTKRLIKSVDDLFFNTGRGYYRSFFKKNIKIFEKTLDSPFDLCYI